MQYQGHVCQHTQVDGAKDWPAKSRRKALTVERHRQTAGDDSDEKSLERGGALRVDEFPKGRAVPGNEKIGCEDYFSVVSTVKYPCSCYYSSSNSNDTYK